MYSPCGSYVGLLYKRWEKDLYTIVNRVKDLNTIRTLIKDSSTIATPHLDVAIAVSSPSQR